jgi:flagellar biosynthesis GTPase FlhF
MATSTATSTPAASSTTNWLESVLPGVSNLTTSATGVIGNLLNGLPSASQARTTNAYYGAGNGQTAGNDVNSFIDARGSDLYNTQANANQQTGLSDLNSLLGTYTTAATNNQSVQNQNTQAANSLAQQNAENTQSQSQQLQEYTNSLNQANNQFTQSQDQQNTQFNNNLNQNQNQFTQSQTQNQNQFNSTNQLNQFQEMLNAMGLGNSIVGNTTGNLTTY